VTKKIFTPFPRDHAGSLAGRLAYIEDKPNVEGKPENRYKGFKPGEYVYSPNKRFDGSYETTRELDPLRDAADELYINAHCSKGIDYLTNKEDTSDKGAMKVEIDDLIKQLKAHGLPPETAAKVKLWVCEGALDKGLDKSFAQRFSVAMTAAGYTRCRIFGYVLSVFADYKSGEDGELHKRVVKSDKQRFKDLLPYFRQSIADYTHTQVGQFDFTKLPQVSKALVGDSKLKNMALIWGVALSRQNKDEDAAIDEILAGNRTNIETMLGKGHGGIAGRASNSRKEFKDGLVVPG
jgi:hypothetical protein